MKAFYLTVVLLDNQTYIYFSIIFNKIVNLKKNNSAKNLNIYLAFVGN
jgi:hypothetical protein